MEESDLRKHLQKNYPKEDGGCEWKEFKNLKHAISSHAGNDLISYISGISNMAGGHIILGVEDESLKIVGIQDTHNYTPENLPQTLVSKCSNLNSEGLEVQEFITSDSKKTVWVIHVPRHLPRQPVLAHKKAWQRIGESLTFLTPERKRMILEEPIYDTQDWSAGIIEGATLRDLSKEAIEIARENFKVKNPSLKELIEEWDDLTFLNKGKLAIKGKITRAALILLGNDESVHFLSPANLKMSWILKDDKNEVVDYKHFGPPYILAVNKVFNKIRNLRYRYLKEDTLFPYETDKYDSYVIREALHNCIAHQNYELGGRIHVLEFPEKLIFSNLGNFIPGSIEKVIKSDSPAELYRNPQLANAMVNLNMIDTVGSGIRKMFTQQRDKFFPMPEYQIDERRVEVSIIGRVLDIEYAKVLAKNPELSLEEIIMLDKVQKQKELSDEEIKHLRSKKLIDGRKPNFYISARVAKRIGKKGKYVKQKGLNNDYYKELLITYLKEFDKASRKEFEEVLLDKLPEVLSTNQKKDKVKNLLQSLRKEGKIVTTKGREWVLSNGNN